MHFTLERRQFTHAFCGFADAWPEPATLPPAAEDVDDWPGGVDEPSLILSLSLAVRRGRWEEGLGWIPSAALGEP